MNRQRFVSHLRNVVLAALACAAAPAFCAQGDERPPLPVGINLRAVTPYDREWVFADAMKLASPWGYVDPHAKPRSRSAGRPADDSSDDGGVPVDERGWPRPAAGRTIACQVFVGMPGHFPAGRYVCTWKGSGRFAFRGALRVASEGDHRVELDVDPDSGGAIELQLQGSDASDPTTDIRLWLPGLETTGATFHPLFLERLRPFSVLRFYPWMRVYTSSGRWGRRSTPASARQSTSEGVAVEYMVELCNELRADPWFCMPHVADDEYVRSFAELVRDTLSPERRVYVEFSNEVWNTDYGAGQWARAEAQRRDVPLAQVTAEGAARVFAIWHEVFGAAKERVVRVASGQLHNPGVARALCRQLGGQLDAIAVGAYFAARSDRDDVDRESSPAKLLACARRNLADLVLPRIADHHALAETLSRALGRPIALLAYEGGQSIVGRGAGGGLDPAATLACQELPEMFTAYRELIDGARARGLELFVGYDFAGARNNGDTFSVLQYLDQPIEDAAKYRALIQGWEDRNLLPR